MVLLDGLTGQVTKYTPVPRPLALALVILALLAAATGFWWFVGPQVVQQIDQLEETIPEALATLEEWMLQYPWGEAVLDEAPVAEDVVQAEGALGRLTSVFTTAFGIVFNLIVILFIGPYGAFRPSLYIDNAFCLLLRFLLWASLASSSRVS